MKTIESIIKKISYTTALRSILVICTCVIIFHILIILKIIPYDIVRGGRLTNDTEMYRFESFSILLNFLIIFLVAMKGEYISYVIPEKVVRILMRGFVYLLGANTIANIFSESLFEAIFFTILVGILAICMWRIQLEE